MAKKADRRVIRTRQLLRGALISLIREKGFESLTVQEIIDRANVGRATFYAHFDNKEDLLVSGFEELRTTLKDRQREAFTRGAGVDERVFGFSMEMFAHANEYREVFRAMGGKHSGAVVQQLLRKLLVDLIRGDLKAMAAQAGSGALPAESAAEFVAGGLFGLLLWWLTAKTRLSPEEMNSLFRRLAVPAVKAALL